MGICTLLNTKYLVKKREMIRFKDKEDLKDKKGEKMERMDEWMKMLLGGKGGSLFIDLLVTYKRDVSLKYQIHHLKGCVLRHQRQPLEEVVSFKIKTHSLKQIMFIKKICA